MVAAGFGRRGFRRALARLALLGGLALLVLVGFVHGRATGAARATAAARRVVAYFPTFIRDDGYTENDIDFSTVNVVAHGPVAPRPDGSLLYPPHFPDPALVAKAHAAGAAIVLVVGDDQPATARAFSTVVADPALRHAFVANLLREAQSNGYDGIDIDWEYPRGQADRVGLTALAADLRSALGAGRTLSIAVAPTDWGAHDVDVAALAPLVDWFDLMTYDVAGAGWSTIAGNNAPLYSTPQQPDSIDAAVAYMLGRGAPPAKLLIGLSFYGQRFDDATGLYAPLSGTSGGALQFRAIATLIGDGWIARRDAVAAVPYLVRADGSPGVISYDDVESIAAKCRYAIDRRLGGAVVWRLGQDGVGPPAAQPLLQAARGCR